MKKTQQGSATVWVIALIVVVIGIIIALVANKNNKVSSVDENRQSSTVSGKPLITLASPKDGQVLKLNSSRSFPVSWTLNYIPKGPVKAYLMSPDSGQRDTIALQDISFAGTGTQNSVFSVPASVLPGKYRLFICDSNVDESQVDGPLMGCFGAANEDYFTLIN